MAANSKKSGSSAKGKGTARKTASGQKRQGPESVNINGRKSMSRGRNTKTAVMEPVVESRSRSIGRAPAVKKNSDAKRDDIIIIVVTLVCILMVLSYLNICGVVGTGINAFVFGMFGRLGYIIPFIVWVLTVFIIANKDNGVSPLGIVYAVLLSGVLGALIHLAVGEYDKTVGVFEYFTNSSLGYEGASPTYGGLIGGLFVKLLYPLVGKVATVLILIALLLILFVLMTGKPFIMAVVRKFNRRINDYRRRRAIEKNEQGYYEDLEYAPENATPSGVRYGVRRPPERRMGTMNVSFTKKGAAPAAEKTVSAEKTSKNAKNAKRTSVQEPGMDERRQEQKPAPQKTANLYIPGIGNVPLGKNSASQISETEYTDLDFAEVADDGRQGLSGGIKKETTRKHDEFADDNRITRVGVKTLHSGSIRKTEDDNIMSVEGIRKRTAEYVKPYLDDELYNSTKEPANDMDSELYDARPDYDSEKDIAEQVRKLLDDQEDEEKALPDSSDNVTPIARKEIIEVIPDEKETTAQKDDQVSRTSEKTDDEKNAEEKTTEVEQTEEADKAKKQYENVTRIGSGAAVFIDVTKEPEKPVIHEYKFPPLSLLNKSKIHQQNAAMKKNELEATIQKLQSTFESFGVGVRVTDASIGSTVTRYELLPDQGVKVKTITALSDDIKLALAVPDIRIEAPIPGKAAVGIEVPNKESTPVLFGDLIDSDEFRNSKSTLAFAVGKDIGGKSIVSDIGGMPHALIAGATGSGKSVCINALIMSILYKAKPTDVKMIMIDPKRVELVGYNGIPHLLVPVVTDVKKASGALNWAIAEMDDRYKRFAENAVTNLASYNTLMEERFIEEGGEGECPDKLPRILIIVDELNDLMMTANSKEVEADICRLTQLARACGIHVILATQRPSVNVITGTIKANIPTRIAFAVSSLVDSRTIIDQAGAEKLIGKGDMLFYPQGYPKPVRLQGAYVSDAEVAKVVKYIKDQCKEVKYSDLISNHIEANSADKQQSKDEGGAQAEASDKDEFFEEAGRLIIKKQKASVGMLQREFRIGFNRAARIMDKLAEEGIVGPEDSTKPRKILMTMEEFEAYLAAKGQE